MSPEEEYCKCHYKHVTQINLMQDELKTKLNSKVFYLLVSVAVIVMSGMFGSQMAIYSSVKNTETEVAVIKESIENHLEFHERYWNQNCRNN